MKKKKMKKKILSRSATVGTFRADERSLCILIITRDGCRGIESECVDDESSFLVSGEQKQSEKE